MWKLNNQKKKHDTATILFLYNKRSTNRFSKTNPLKRKSLDEFEGPADKKNRFNLPKPASEDIETSEATRPICKGKLH